MIEGLGKVINSEQGREAASGVKWPTAIWGPGPLWYRCESFIHWLLQVWIKLTAGKDNLTSWRCGRNSEGRNPLCLTGVWPGALEVTHPTHCALALTKKINRNDHRRPRPQFLNDPVKKPFHQPHVSCTRSHQNNADTHQNRLLCKLGVITAYKKM